MTLQFPFEVDLDTMEVIWTIQEFPFQIGIFINLIAKFKIIKMLMKLEIVIWYL